MRGARAQSKGASSKHYMLQTESQSIYFDARFWAVSRHPVEPQD